MRYIRILLSSLAFLTVCSLINTFCLHSYNKITLYHNDSLDKSIKIYFTAGINNKLFTEKFSQQTESTKEVNGTYQTSLHLNNKIIKTLRIDPGTVPGIYEINSIKLHSFFGPPVILSPADSSLSSVSDSSSSLSVQSDKWILNSQGDDPYLIITGHFKTQNNYLLVFPPLCWSLFVYFLIGKIDLKNTLLYHDSKYKKPSSGLNFAALDGLRGFAALLVIADHTGLPGFDNLAPEGVILFFCLSGFLLTMPFATQPERGASGSYCRSYLLRRIKRIVPMFYFVAIAGYFFEANLSDLVRSLLFIQGKGIKWTVLQEMYFYLLLPVLMFSSYKIFKGRSLACFLFLLAGAILFNTGLIPTIPVYGLGARLPLYLGLFMTGMAMCYLRNSQILTTDSLLTKILGNPLINLLLIGLIFFYRDLLAILPWTTPPSPLTLYHSNFCIIAGLLITAATLTKTNLITRIFSIYPLRLIGLVGYSIYLLHPIVHIVDKQIFVHYLGHNPGGSISFAVCLTVTFLLSTISYTYIERPFIRAKV